jgi:hypothetical protein
MSKKELARYSGAVAPHRRSPYEKTVEAIQGATGVQVTALRAIAGVGEQAMFDVTQVKRTQRELEQMNPDAAEVIALIANTTCMAIARSVNRFGFELGG